MSEAMDAESAQVKNLSQIVFISYELEYKPINIFRDILLETY